jgi:general secretion pathway protein H
LSASSGRRQQQHRRSAGRPARGHGFTLIEVTVVIFIIGILATLVTLSIGNRTLDDRLENESVRMEQLLRLAQEDAQLKGIVIGVRFTAGGYEFLTLDDKSHWVDYAQSGTLRARRLDQPFFAQLQIEGRMVPPAPDLPAGGAGDDPQQQPRPQILLLPGGESTVFAIDLLAPRYRPFYHIEADALGHLMRERRMLSQ